MKQMTAKILLLTLLFTVMAAPVYAQPTNVKLTTIESNSIDAQYNSIIADRAALKSMDAQIKSLDKNNGTLNKTIVANAPFIAAEVTVRDNLKLQKSTTEATYKEDLDQLAALTAQLAAETKAKNEAGITKAAIERNRLLNLLKPALDQLANLDKDIKSKTQQLKPNAAKKQQEDLKAVLDQTNLQIKTLWTNVKTEEKNEKDALKDLGAAILATDVQKVIDSLTAIHNAKVNQLAYKQQITDLQNVQGGLLLAIQAKEPVAKTTMPKRSETNVSVSSGSIEVVFNEPVTAVALSQVTVTSSAGSAVGGLTFSLSGQTLTITHNGLAAGTTYIVKVPAGTVKNNGSTNNRAFDWSFTTQ